jgi:hypothetical protein
MTKNLTLAASMMMLVAISGPAIAGTAAPHAHHWPEATSASSRQALQAFDAFNPAMATQPVEPNAHRYEGGPKSND